MTNLYHYTSMQTLFAILEGIGKEGNEYFLLSDIIVK